MKKIVYIFVCFSIPLISQIKSKSADAFEELETGNLTLRFFNAVNGSPIIGGKAVIDSVGEFFTDDEGKILFASPVENAIMKVSFTAEQYIPTTFPIEIMAGTLFFNRISISPLLDVKFLRIVVDWDEEPKDLDAHFVKQDSYHLSYRHMKTLADGTGMLDIDAMNGYGPETITLKEVSNTAVYQYYIHDYSNQKNSVSKNLSNSKATVKVYGDGKLLKYFQVPRKKEGTVWRVFTLERGQICEINQIGNN